MEQTPQRKLVPGKRWGTKKDVMDIDANEITRSILHIRIKITEQQLEVPHSDHWN